MFFLTFFTVLTTIYGYIGWRLIMPAAFASPWNGVLWGVLSLFWLLPLATLVLRMRKLRPRWRDQLSLIAFLSLGFFLLVFSMLVIRDMSLLLTVGVKKATALAHNNEMQVQLRAIAPFGYGLRHLINITNIGVLSFAGMLIVYGIYSARRRPRVVTVEIPIADLPADLEGFRIAQISDLHVGPTIKRDFVQRTVNQVNGLSADMIVFTGDLADGSVSALRNEVAPLAGLSAPHGVYFVTGNHEYYSGAETWIAEVRRLGLEVLLNEHRLLQKGRARLLVAGVTDYNAGDIIRSHHTNPAAAFANAPASEVKILLAHQPRSIFAAAKLGVDLQISGHTHGGQFFPGNLMVRMQQPYVAGLYRHEKTWLYISRGTGYWGPPIRLGAPPEITVITLKSARRDHTL